MLVNGAPEKDGDMAWHCLNSLRPSGAYASVTQRIIGSDNGLSPVQRQSHYLSQSCHIVMIIMPNLSSFCVCQNDHLCSLCDLRHYWLKYSSVSGNLIRNSWTCYLRWTISRTIHAVAHCSSSLIMWKQPNTELIHLCIKEPSNGIHNLRLPMPKILNALTYLRTT